MKSNLPDSTPKFPKLTPAQALQQPGFYFVTSSVMPEAENAETGEKASLVCLMIVTDGKMYICNPTQEITAAQLAKGLTFQGPLSPDKP